MEQNYSTSNTTNSTETAPGEIYEDSYIVGIAGFVIVVIVAICIISICVRAYKKSKKLIKKQRKALLKKDHISSALLGNKNPYISPYPVEHVGYVDPNAYPYIPPQSSFAYPSAYPHIPN